MGTWDVRLLGSFPSNLPLFCCPRRIESFCGNNVSVRLELHEPEVFSAMNMVLRDGMEHGVLLASLPRHCSQNHMRYGINTYFMFAEHFLISSVVQRRNLR